MAQVSDDLLSDGLLSIARLARRRLLRPGGTFYPRRSVAYAALASVRTTSVCGFDCRPWNAFRHWEGPVYDFEEVLLNEPGCGTLLSEPTLLFALDLNSPPSQPPPPTEHLELTATAAGLFNCVVCWFDLDYGEHGGTLSFAPDHARPKHMYFRAIKNRLRFTGYERRLAAGESVAVTLNRSDVAFEVSAPPSRAAEQQGRQVAWPAAPLLSYHFPMIAEMPRNVRFERALLRAVRRRQPASNAPAHPAPCAGTHAPTRGSPVPVGGARAARVACPGAGLPAGPPGGARPPRARHRLGHRPAGHDGRASRSEAGHLLRDGAGDCRRGAADCAGEW